MHLGDLAARGGLGSLAGLLAHRAWAMSAKGPLCAWGLGAHWPSCGLGALCLEGLGAAGATLGLSLSGSCGLLGLIVGSQCVGCGLVVGVLAARDSRPHRGAWLYVGSQCMTRGLLVGVLGPSSGGTSRDGCLGPKSASRQPWRDRAVLGPGSPCACGIGPAREPPCRVAVLVLAALGSRVGRSRRGGLGA